MVKAAKIRGSRDPAPARPPEPVDLDYDVDDLSEAEVERVRKAAHPDGDPVRKIKRVGERGW